MLSHGMTPRRVTVEPALITIFSSTHSSGSVVNSFMPSITMSTCFGVFIDSDDSFIMSLSIAFPFRLRIDFPINFCFLPPFRRKQPNYIHKSPANYFGNFAKPSLLCKCSARRKRWSTQKGIDTGTSYSLNS